MAGEIAEGSASLEEDWGVGAEEEGGAEDVAEEEVVRRAKRCRIEH